MLTKFPLGLFALLIGCGSPQTPERVRLNDSTPFLAVASEQIEDGVEEGYEYLHLHLDVDGILVIFDSLGEFDPDIFRKASDSLFYPLGTGEGPRGFTIRSRSYRITEVSQSFRTTMTAGSGGDRCDLEGWKHYEAPWEKLRLGHRQGSVSLQTLEPPDGAYERFPKYSYSELLAEVQRRCGKELADGLRISDSISKTRDSINYDDDRWWVDSSPSISDYTYRIKAVHLTTGDTVKKYIRLEFASGC